MDFTTTAPGLSTTADLAGSPPSSPPPNAPVAFHDDVARLTYFLRRITAWILDGLVLSIPLIGMAFASFSLIGVAMGASFGLAGGGTEGLVSSGITAMLTTLLAFLLVGLAMLVIPVGYLMWAVRRGGPHHGQTLGQQVMELRIERTRRPDLRVSTRLMIGRALLLQVVWFASWIAPVIVGAVAGSGAITLLTWLVLVGVVLWRAADGRLPHDRLSATRMAHRAGEPGVWDGAR